MDGKNRKSFFRNKLNFELITIVQLLVGIRVRGFIKLILLSTNPSPSQGAKVERLLENCDFKKIIQSR